MFSLQRLLLVILPLLLVFSLLAVGCGDDADDGGNDDETLSEPIETGETVLGSSGDDYQWPIIHTKSDQTKILLFHDGQTFYQTPVSQLGTGSGSNNIIDMAGSSIPIHTTAITMSPNYIVWNSNHSYRHRFGGGTEQAETGQLVPGFCINADAQNREQLVAVRTGGEMYKIVLSNFRDRQEMNNSITYLNHPDTNEPLRIKGFACSGSTGLAATPEGELFFIDLEDDNPTPSRLVQNASFGTVVYEKPYFVWVDEIEYDIWMFNVATKEAPQKVADILRPSPIDDMRVFGSVVIWSDDTEGNYDVWALDLSRFETDENYTATSYIQVTKNAADQRYPFLDGTVVYWQDNRNGDWEIQRGALPKLWFETEEE